MEERRNNCFGYVFYREGINSSEIPVGTQSLEEILDLFREVDPNEATTIGRVVLGGTTEIPRRPVVTHLAFVEPKDPNFVWHRPDCGKDIERTPRAEVMASFLDNGAYEPLYLRRR